MGPHSALGIAREWAVTLVLKAMSGAAAAGTLSFSSLPSHQVIPFLGLPKNDPFFGTSFRSHQTVLARNTGRK